jgi:hypothetical protein
MQSHQNDANRRHYVIYVILTPGPWGRILWAVPVDLSNLPVRERLGRRIRSLRALRGWTQGDLAEASGLHRSYVSSVERGERNVGVENLVLLADAFGVTLAELLAEV